MKKIVVEATIDAPIDKVWRAWTTPDDIVQWNAASDDWHTTRAAVDLRAGGWQAILDNFARHVQARR